VAFIAAAVCVMPWQLIRSAAQHGTTPGAGLGYLGIFLFYIPLAALAPALLAAIWLGGYGYWRSHMTTPGRSAGWPTSKVFTYVALSLLAAYVLTFSACNGVLPGFRQ